MHIASAPRLRLGVALLALTFGSAAFGQAANYPAGAIVQSLERGPGDELAGFLAELNKSPRSLSALLGAGNAALALGDMQGALSFFARAEEVAPRDGRVKAGMGAAFVQSENPQAAFRFFAEAQALGIPVRDFAKDRGLAYDMVGDPVHAQADYALALSGGSDPEVERRMALSKAISGDKAGALAVLDPQIRRQDRAGWRTRAFVLALTGDAPGAAGVAQTMMPGRSGAMQPFFERLPQLSAADKAAAVHFGRFPQTGRAFAVASAPAPAPVQTPVTQAPSQYGPTYRGVARTTPVQQAPAPTTPPAQQPQRVTPNPSPLSAPQTRPTAPQPLQVASNQPGHTTPQGRGTTPLPASTKPADPTPDRLQFADVVSTIGALPHAAETKPQPKAAAPTAKPAAKPAVTKTAQADKPAAAAKADTKHAAKKGEAAKKPDTAKGKEAAKPKEPSRIWVQLAAGANKQVFPSEYKKMQAKAPKLLSGKTAWTTPLGATNRLLIGPFKTDKEARDLVNELAKLKLGSYSWKSEDGQAVEKLPAK